MGLFKCKAEKELIEKAENGDSEAMMTLSNAYDGTIRIEGIKEDKKLSNMWFNRAVSAKHPVALRIEGNWNVTEGARRKDQRLYELGKSQLVELYNMGHPEGAYLLAMRHHDDELKFIYHDQTYLYYLRLADELGSASAQLVLGNEYYSGKLLERDLQKSLSYFEKSFNNENVRDNDKYYAMSASGDIMIDENMDLEEAVKRILEADEIHSDNKDPFFLWDAGKACEKAGNIEKALECYTRASKYRSKYADMAKDRILILTRSMKQ